LLSLKFYIYKLNSFNFRYPFIYTTCTLWLDILFSIPQTNGLVTVHHQECWKLRNLVHISNVLKLFLIEGMRNPWHVLIIFLKQFFVLIATAENYLDFLLDFIYLCIEFLQNLIELTAGWTPWCWEIQTYYLSILEDGRIRVCSIRKMIFLTFHMRFWIKFVD